jgi:hypothetical protein
MSAGISASGAATELADLRHAICGRVRKNEKRYSVAGPSTSYLVGSAGSIRTRTLLPERM